MPDKSPLKFIAGSAPTQILVTVVVYAFYAAIMGISLVPSAYLVVWGAGRLSVRPEAPGDIVLFCCILGLSVNTYFITGILVMGSAIRILSLGIRPGRYPRVSLVMLRWLIYSGIYHLAGTTILNYIPMTFFSMLFFRLMGAKIGKNVYLNTWNLNDAYLMEIGDNVVIGGKSDLSCHTFESDCLVLSPIRIGKDTLIGTRCYISPGVTIGSHCVIGMYSFIRKNKTIPDRTFISSLAGMPVRNTAALEKLGGRAHTLSEAYPVSSGGDHGSSNE